jgi:hypothetical protein
MQPPPSYSDPNVGRKPLLSAANLLGLVILRAILGSIPIEKNASPFGDSLMTPLLLSYVIVDTVMLVVIVDFGTMLARYVQAKYRDFPDLRKVTLLATAFLGLAIAYRIYEMPTACLVVRRTELLSSLQGSTPTHPGKPSTEQPTAASLESATGDALVPYQHLAVVLFRRSPDAYGWIFLILVASPVIGMVVLVWRNLQPFSHLFSQAASTFRGSAQFSKLVMASAALGKIQAVSKAAQIPSRRERWEKLAKLKSLWDSGVISRQDFEIQKQRMLNQGTSDSKPAEPEDFQELKALLDSEAVTQGEYESEKTRLLKSL